MPPAITVLTSRWPAPNAGAGQGIWPIAAIAAIHLGALALMAWSEIGAVAMAVFLLTWGLLNFFWLAVLRRPAVSAALSLVMIVVLILLSGLKHDIISMTAGFLDLWIINTDTVAFLVSIRPDLAYATAGAAVIAVPALALLWSIDPFQVRLRTATGAFAACLAGLSCLTYAFPQEDWEAWFGDSFVSKFTRSAAATVAGLLNGGYLESDAAVTDRLKPLSGAVCTPTRKPPHILLVHDESSFDIRVLPGVTVPADYGAHFRSLDGKTRRFITENAGGPSWYTEYNVLAGLSARSFGRFAYHVTQIAAGRVERGLPAALRRCGYRTMSIYPALGAFMSARSFQTTAGVQKFIDQRGLGTNRVEPDQFYYDAALRLIEGERDKGPIFLFVYLAQNHWPWDFRWRPDLMPDWKDLGNQPGLDEYLRRQAMSFRDYARLLDRLEREFPGEAFLLVRYGDHQPTFATAMIDPTLDREGVNGRLIAHDPRYFATYYAIDAINFEPANLSSALDSIEAPYLPLIVQEAAGLPLDSSFVEQKRILERCKGLFHSCAGGAEARRFNRLLIDAGLIKGL